MCDGNNTYEEDLRGRLVAGDREAICELLIDYCGATIKMLVKKRITDPNYDWYEVVISLFSKWDTSDCFQNQMARLDLRNRGKNPLKQYVSKAAKNYIYDSVIRKDFNEVHLLYDKNGHFLGVEKDNERKQRFDTDGDLILRIKKFVPKKISFSHMKNPSDDDAEYYDPEDMKANVTKQVEENELNERIESIVEELREKNPIDAIIFNESFLQERTYDEIANKHGISPSAVRQRSKRLKRKLNCSRIFLILRGEK